MTTTLMIMRRLALIASCVGVLTAFALVAAYTDVTPAQAATIARTTNRQPAAVNYAPPPTLRVPTSSRLRPMESTPVWVYVKEQGFTVFMPTDGDPTELSLWGPSPYSDLQFNRSRTQLCPSSFQGDPRCHGFLGEAYSVLIYHFPRHSPAYALGWIQRHNFNPTLCDRVYATTFKGAPAVRARFHTATGGYGPNIAVWHRHIVYILTANGFWNRGAAFANEFFSSFRFRT